MNTTVLQVQGLKKNYGPRQAVREISFSVHAGELLGLLGPNGAGKSSTLGMVAGLSAPDAGSVSVGGIGLAQDEAGYKARIGLVPQDIALFEDLPAQTNVELFGALYGCPKPRLRQRAAEVLEMVGLADRARDKPASFSGGMKRRLNIACALVHDPELLLLDEPTAGVDPQSRNAIFEQLEALKRAGKALVYTTHYMEEVERLADRVLIMDHGQLLASGTLPELYRQLPAAQTLQLEVEDAARLDLAALRALVGIKKAELRGSQLHIGLDELGTGSQLVLQALAAAGVAVRHLSSGRANLEDVFLSLTGRQLRD
ncbi:ABC-2 type transport system ATP-binding protein [Paucibacter oligotrophus]|uniref:ABC-2 type transport system ATP-binding protein n=1 Tax=Roseateles oligotrophus TaxID=1769250 RepID=A0A840L9C0_9BURK|nr:ABC transporter ATP-binding protein [Roseateles oligotrophus]MBB4842729.1 ABC-2 type transport system ATP-binding protein [Roseateles oligotrophus]